MNDVGRFQGDTTVSETLRVDDLLVLAITGEIDLATSPELRHGIDALLDQQVRHLLLDFSEVAYCDSSGMNVLIDVLRALHVQHGSLTLTSAPRIVERALRITGLNHSIGLQPDLASALKSLDAQSAPPPD